MAVQDLHEARHVRALEVMRQTDIHVERCDGVLDAFGFILDLDRVANGFDADLVDGYLAGIGGALYAVIGGAGAEIERVLGERGLNVAVLRLGLPDRFIDHGEQGQLLAELGLDKDGIVRSVRERLTQ